MTDELARFMVSIQAQPFRKKTRYHWMICNANNPDEMVSWGHADTLETAEIEARNEVNDLTSGFTQGGQVASAKAFCNSPLMMRRRLI